MAGKRNTGFWIIQVPGWLLFLYLFVAQGLAGFSYDLGVRMGSQESPEQITEVGAADGPAPGPRGGAVRRDLVGSQRGGRFAFGRAVGAGCAYRDPDV